MATAGSPQRENEALWRKVLTEGEPGKLTFLPGNPRCVVCYTPFGSLGGRLTNMLYGYRPSRKNPNMCNYTDDGMPPGGAEIDLAVLFADVRGSTALGERLGATAFAALLNRFYRAATDVLLAHDAVIDKMIGDDVMALFVPKLGGPNYRRRAAQAAEALVRAAGYKGKSEPWLPLGVGVHAGLAYMGKVGSEGVNDFTALGDTINTAARLQAEAAGGEVVLSETIYQEIAERYPDLEQRVLNLRGREEPLAVRILRPGS